MESGRQIETNFEKKFAPLCNIITSCDHENWDKRNKPMLAMTELVQEIDTLTLAAKEAVFKVIYSYLC